LLILTRGLPGSGKTTWAKHMLQQNPGMFVHVSRDQIRLELKSEKTYDGYMLEREERDRRIQISLEEGRSVILDETNLNIQNVEGLREKFETIAEIQIKDFTNADLDQCIGRRIGIVPENEIRIMYAKMRVNMENRNWPNFPEPSFEQINQVTLKGNESVLD
jgi:broad-specificity NMP kinase